MKPILKKSIGITAKFFSSLKTVMQHPMGCIGVLLVGLFLFSAIFAPIISPYNPSDFVGDSLAGPSLSHPIGTDELGRDTFCRVIYGGRIELVLAIAAVSISLFLGLVLGMIAGYGPVWLDNCMVLVFDTIRSFPSIMLSLAILALTEPSVIIIGIVFIINATPGYGRIARAQTLSLKNKEFILAEQSLGAKPMRVILHHLLPNIIGPLLILCAMDIPVVVTVEAGLSFLGLGVLPPTPTWGTILNEGFSVIRESPWPVIAGGVPLILTTLGFTFLGETLRDLFDPKLKGK
ncbi:MAG: ABC transporter permease [Desulfobacteraceae bacterium]|nr:MAG: ABC transporter permease [Desulfobacteraceae bacterium]